MPPKPYPKTPNAPQRQVSQSDIRSGSEDENSTLTETPSKANTQHKALRISFQRPNNTGTGSYTIAELRGAIGCSHRAYQEFRSLLFFLFAYHSKIETLSLHHSYDELKQEFCNIVSEFIVYLPEKTKESLQEELTDDLLQWVLYQLTIRLRIEFRAAKKKDPSWKPEIPDFLRTAIGLSLIPHPEDFPMQELYQQIYIDGPGLPDEIIVVQPRQERRDSRKVEQVLLKVESEDINGYESAGERSQSRSPSNDVDASTSQGPLRNGTRHHTVVDRLLLDILFFVVVGFAGYLYYVSTKWNSLG